MRVSTLAPLAFAIAPAAVSAAGSLGFALGTKLADGTCKATSDYEADFDAIAAASSAKIVRGYAASDCNYAQNILPAAKTKGFKVVLGIW
jgi:glucan 1,3-beta-glucosidase